MFRLSTVNLERCHTAGYLIIRSGAIYVESRPFSSATNGHFFSISASRPPSNVQTQRRYIRQD